MCFVEIPELKSQISVSGICITFERASFPGHHMHLEIELELYSVS